MLYFLFAKGLEPGGGDTIEPHSVEEVPKPVTSKTSGFVAGTSKGKGRARSPPVLHRLCLAGPMFHQGNQLFAVSG